MKENIYTSQIRAQGREPSNKPADLGEFPKTIYGRTYETEADYREALHEFLNGC